MLQRMATHPNIMVLLNAGYREIQDEVKFDGMVYTGLIDEFFDYMYGELPYRSLRFEFKYHLVDAYQEVAQVNYPNDQPYTRISEYKHITGQRAYGTSVSIEYPHYLESEPLYCNPVAPEHSRRSALSQIIDNRCFLASPGIWVGANVRLKGSGNERSLCACGLSPRTRTSRAKGAASWW
jgi:UDP-galactopyranose mutase